MPRLGGSISKGSASARSANFPLFWAVDDQPGSCSNLACSSLNQIIPAIPHRVLEVPLVWNPVRATFRRHFDPAIIKPPEDVKLIRHGVTIARILAAESVVGHDCGETVAALASLPQWTLSNSAVIAMVPWRRNHQASHRRSGHWMIRQADSRLRFWGSCSLL
jgi:hypothetical protein